MPTVAENHDLADYPPARERNMDFERGVLQDNIILCDAKSGVLLAFAGGMVIFCLEAVVSARRAAGPAPTLTTILLLLAAAGFLASCHFSLTTILPRLMQGDEDHIFWESSIFKLPLDAYFKAMEALDAETERMEKLRHLHRLAGICRAKFSHFNRAVRIAQAAFVVLVVAELSRLI